MRNNVFLTIRVAFVGFSLTLCSSLHAAAPAPANPQKVTDAVYTKALYDKDSKTMFLAGKKSPTAAAGTDVETTLAKVQYDATAQQWSIPTKLSTATELKNKTIADLTLIKNNATFPVVITNDKKLHVVTDATTGDIKSSAVLKDGGTPDEVKTIKAIASDGKDYIFAAVSENGKEWSAHDGEKRGIAVAKVEYDASGIPNAITQEDVTDFTKADKAAALPAAAADKMAALTAAKPLAFKASDDGIDSAELMENVSMHYASEVGDATTAPGTLFVGLQGVTRNDKYKEGGVSSLVLGKLDTTSTPNKFELASATPNIKAPYIDILTAHQKVAIANCVYAVEHALQSTVDDPKKPSTITDNAKALAYRELLALGASIIAASAGVTIADPTNPTAVEAQALGLAIAKAVAKRATTLTFDATTPASAANGTRAAAASVVAGTFAGAWLGKVIGGVAAGQATATAIEGAATDIKNLYYPKTGDSTEPKQAFLDKFNTFATHAKTATDGLGAKLETGINQNDLASAVVGKYNATDIFPNMSTQAPLHAKLNRLVYESKIAVLGNASPAAQTGVAAAGYTIAAVAAKIKNAADDDAVNAILPQLSLIAQAFAKAIAINPVVGVEAMWAVNKLLDAYGSVTYNATDAANNLTDKLAAAQTVTDEYIQNISYADAALAVKKAAKLAEKTPTPATDVHPIVAAVAAGAALDTTILAAKTKQLTDATKIKNVTELADALDAWDKYIAGPTQDTAKTLIEKTTAYAGKVDQLKANVGGTDTHAKFEDDASGYSTGTQNADTAEATRAKVATFLVDAAGVNAKIPVLGDTATVLNDLVNLKGLQKATIAAIDTSADTNAAVKATAAAVQTYADQFGTLKVAANTAAHMVASYSAPRDTDFWFCGKTAMLDAKSRLDDNIKQEVAVFDANGDDALALTAGTMKTMTVGANHYLIANIVTQAPGQRAGSLFISGTKNMLCALPLATDSGEIAQMVNNVPDFTKAARNMYELPRIDYASVRVGGTATLFSGAWVNDIIVEGTRVYVVLGGYKPDFMGIFYSDAITTDNVITGWTAWKRYKGAQTTYRYLTAALDNTDGLAFVQGDLGTFGYPINSIAYLPFPTTATVESDQYKTVKSRVNEYHVIDGVVNMFEFDHETPGIATDKASFGVALLYDSLVLFQTGEFTDGSYHAASDIEDAITIPCQENTYKTHADAFKAIAPLTSAAFVADASNQGWLVVGGNNGLVGITQDAKSRNDGKGFTNAASQSEVYDATEDSAVVTLKDAADKPFSRVRQVLGYNDTIYIVTEQKVQCAEVKQASFAAGTNKLATTPLLEPGEPYVCTFASILSDKYMVVCTTKGITLIENHQYSAAGGKNNADLSTEGVTLQAMLIEHQGAQELLVLFSDIVTKRSVIKRYAINLDATSIAGVATYKGTDTDLAFDSSFILSFACDGDTIIASAPETGLVYYVNIETKKTTIINTDFDRPGLAAYDKASGNFLIPGSQGIGVK